VEEEKATVRWPWQVPEWGCQLRQGGDGARDAAAADPAARRATRWRRFSSSTALCRCRAAVLSYASLITSCGAQDQSERRHSGRGAGQQRPRGWQRVKS